MQSFEALNQRAVAVVVDPIQSVKGKVVIDAFRRALLQPNPSCALTNISTSVLNVLPDYLLLVVASEQISCFLYIMVCCRPDLSDKRAVSGLFSQLQMWLDTRTLKARRE